MELVILFHTLNGKWNKVLLDGCTIVHQLDTRRVCYCHIAEVSPQSRGSLCLFDSLGLLGESLRWAHRWEVTEKGEVLCCSANSAFMCTFRSWPNIVKSGLMRRDYFGGLPENVYMLKEVCSVLRGLMLPLSILLDFCVAQQWKWHDETSSLSTKDAVHFPHCLKKGKPGFVRLLLASSLHTLPLETYSAGEKLRRCSCSFEDAAKLEFRGKVNPVVFLSLYSPVWPWMALPSLWSLPDLHNLKESRADLQGSAWTVIKRHWLV